MARLLADEHVPGPFLAVLRSLGHDVVRAKDELEEGSDDERLITYARAEDRTVITCDSRFTIVDGAVRDDHAGVIYARQLVLRTRPEDAASGIDRILSTVDPGTMAGGEFYLSAWL